MDPLFKISDKVYNGLRKHSMADGLIKSFDGSQQSASLDHESGDVLVQDPKGNTTRFSFDRQGFIGAIASPLGRRWLLENDASGKMLGLTDPGGFCLGFDYNSLGNITHIANGTRQKVEIFYDDANRLNKIAYPDKTARQIEYSEMGHATAVTDRVGATEAYEYDPEGELVTITDGNGNRTQFRYGKWKRPDEVQYADGSRESYMYDPNGFLRGINVAGEHVAEIEYDECGKPSKIAYRDGEIVSFKYNDQGKIIEAANDQRIVTYEYNDDGLVLLEDQGGQIIEYHYDELNSLVGLTYPTGEKVVFEYDADLRLASVTDWNKGKHCFSYDVGDRKIIQHSPNGLITTLQQSESGKPQSTNVVKIGITGTEAVFTFSYQYDQEDRVSSVTDSEFGTRQFAYDGESQLLSVSSDRPGKNETFAYDRSGNRTHCNGEAAHFNSLNQLTSQGASRCAYDARGNLVSCVTSGVAWRYTYNSRNLLIKAVDQQGHYVSFGYDAFGRRVWKRSGGNETCYFWAGEQIVCEVCDAKKNEYLYHPGTYTPLVTRVNGMIFCYYNDHLGTPRRLTDGQGTTVFSADYSAFGQALTKTKIIPNPLRFAGQYYDEETGLHYNRFRYYSPQLGRYLSRDPITYMAGLNFYSYVSNNSINSIDPLGLSDWKAAVSSAFTSVRNVAVGAVTAVKAVVSPPPKTSPGASQDAGLNSSLSNTNFSCKCSASQGGNALSTLFPPSPFENLSGGQKQPAEPKASRTTPLDSSYMQNVSQISGVYNDQFHGWHTGYDISTAYGNPRVYSIDSGTVVWNSTSSSKYKSKFDKYFNAFVIIKHDGYYSYYGHLNSPLNVGDKVSKGDPIGTVRDAYTKNDVLGPANNHLHISISKGLDWVRGGWGYQSTKEKVESLFVDPKEYIGL
ncbi:MAG: RHS repeat-associated core domain-containing protein [Desulfuromonadaceae bacterium]